MLAAAPTYYLEGDGNSKIAISQEGLRRLVRKVEAELYQSEIYQRTLTALQENADKAVDGSAALIKAVGREAIRLALRQLVKQYRVTSDHAHAAFDSPLTPSFAPDDHLAKLDGSNIQPLKVIEHEATPDAVIDVSPMVVNDVVAPVTLSVVPPQVASLAVQSSTPKPKDGAQDTAGQQRKALLQEIGQMLQQARQAQGMSIEQLHNYTWVPIYHLKALEAGQAEQLPEDIYVCGFIRRVVGVLKIDANTIAPVLSALNASHSVVPSWQRSQPDNFQSMYLYLSYAALIAGACGGLAWMSQYPSSTEMPTPESFSSQTSINQTDRRTTVQPSQAEIIPPEISPPETFVTP